MEIDKKLLAPCGLYCGACGVYISHKSGSDKLKEKLAGAYMCKPEDMVCEGCLSDTRFLYCQMCPIRTCTEETAYEGCYQCGDFPCELIDNFPIPLGKKVIMQAVPEWKELGTEKWVAAQIERYSCPKCGTPFFRGARRCGGCQEVFEVS